MFHQNKCFECLYDSSSFLPFLLVTISMFITLITHTSFRRCLADLREPTVLFELPECMIFVGIFYKIPFALFHRELICLICAYLEELWRTLRACMWIYKSLVGLNRFKVGWWRDRSCHTSHDFLYPLLISSCGKVGLHVIECACFLKRLPPSEAMCNSSKFNVK